MCEQQETVTDGILPAIKPKVKFRARAHDSFFAFPAILEVSRTQPA